MCVLDSVDGIERLLGNEFDTRPWKHSDINPTPSPFSLRTQEPHWATRCNTGGFIIQNGGNFSINTTMEALRFTGLHCENRMMFPSCSRLPVSLCDLRNTASRKIKRNGFISRPAPEYLVTIRPYVPLISQRWRWWNPLSRYVECKAQVKKQKISPWACVSSKLTGSLHDQWFLSWQAWR